jgi:hypothetical protein
MNRIKHTLGCLATSKGNAVSMPDHLRWYRSIAMKALATGVLLGLAGMAQATIVSLSSGDEVLDTTTNLIWLKNLGSSRKDCWAAQERWVAGLTTGCCCRDLEASGRRWLARRGIAVYYRRTFLFA